MTPWDAIVLADAPTANDRLLGLTLVERGRRVVTRAGARRVLVVDGAEAAADVPAWDAARGDAALVIVRAGDQVVHTPLVTPLVAATGARRLAVGPDGAFAGAVWASGDAAAEAAAAVAASPATADRDLAARWTDAARVPHGDIARHAATTPAERAGAAFLLQRLNIKLEDNPVTKHCYRPLSRPLTRLLLPLPVTPNQISVAVGVLGILGCVITAMAGQTALIVGAAIIFFAGVLDGCDGEIARLKLVSSPLGAWLDTIVDEITTTGYFVAIAWHAWVHHPEAWIGHSIWIGALAYVASIYAIYFFCVVVAKKGGSQFYVGTLELAEGPAGWGLRAKQRSQGVTSPTLRAIGAWLLHIKTRDFINLAALGLTFLDAYWVIYLGMLGGGVITALVIVPEHVRLRLQLAELRRRGGTPHLLASS